MQALANYVHEATHDPLTFLLWPAALEEMLLLVSQSKNSLQSFIQVFSVSSQFNQELHTVQLQRHVFF